jgi:hypothetical protein
VDSRTTQRGVTVGPTRILVRPNARAELVLRVANWVRRPRLPDLTFDPDHIVVRQAGRRVSLSGGAGFTLTNGASTPDLRVELQGFRPDLPYTVSAAVVADEGAKDVPIGWRRPLRFYWRFSAAAPTQT